MTGRCEPEFGTHGLMVAVGAGEVQLLVVRAVRVALVGWTVDEW